MRPNHDTASVAATASNPALRAVLLTVLVVLLGALLGTSVAHAGDSEADAAEHVEATPLAVLEATSARGIQDRKPVEPGAALTVGERVWVWLSVANPGEESQVELVWKLDGKTRWTVALEIGHSTRGWRTWAQKKLRKGDHGRWTVDVVAPDGTVLQTVGFDVAPAAETAGDATASAR